MADSTRSEPISRSAHSHLRSVSDSVGASNDYGYTQTVFGSFHENIIENARRMLKEKRGLSAGTVSTTLKKAAKEAKGEVVEEEEEHELYKFQTRWDIVQASLWWGLQKIAHINMLLSFLFALSVITALICVGLDVTVYYLNTGRQYFFSQPIFDGRIYLSFPLWIAYTLVFVGLALFFTHSISPTAAGSGIPEMKSILSGVTLNKYLNIETLIAKLLGLVTALSSGLVGGRAGPFVHIASIIANLLAKMKMFSKIENNGSLKNQMLGAACGVGMAGSHGAVIGGVLFSIEVTSTYYAMRNYWLTFIAAFISGVCYRVLWNSFMFPSASFSPLAPTNFHLAADPSLTDWIGFIILGVVIGVVSVCYVGVNEAIVKFRRTHVSKYKILGPFPYAIMVGLVTAILTFPGFFGTFISNTSSTVLADLIQDRPLNGYGFLQADWGTYSKYFTLISLVAVRFLLQTIVVSVPVPVGVFSPLLALGAAFGRLYGEFLNEVAPNIGLSAPAAYAIAGAAALVGGVTQTLSSAVFIFEITNDLSFSLAVLLVVLISVGISRRFSPSIYESIQKIRGLPYMPDLQEQFYHLKAKDVMEKDFAALALHASIDDINALLEGSSSKFGIDYNIPIVDNQENKLIVGATNMNALFGLVEELEFESMRQTQVHDLKLLAIADPESKRRMKQKFQAKLRVKKYDLRSRLGTILLKAPITFDPQTPIEQIHILFLNMRIKNAFVIKKGAIRGNITQKNLSRALKGK